MAKHIFGFIAFAALLFFVSSSQAESFSVDIDDNGFDPYYLVISEGDTVTWRNQDMMKNHTVTSTDNSSTGVPLFDSGNLTYSCEANTSSCNETFNFTFNNSGVYNYTDLNEDSHWTTHFDAFVYVASCV